MASAHDRGWPPPLIIGAGLGVVIMAVGGATKLMFAGLGTPRLYQWIVLGVAFVVEGYLVSVVAARNTFGSRQSWMWMLVVVAAHFLIVTISYGPLRGILAVVCLANAFVGLKASSVDFQVFWTVDGALKVAVTYLTVA